jgi:hypothetical protein
VAHGKEEVLQDFLFSLALAGIWSCTGTNIVTFFVIPERREVSSAGA